MYLYQLAQAAITKHHRWRGLTTYIYFSQFRRLGSLVPKCWKAQRLVKPSFWPATLLAISLHAEGRAQDFSSSYWDIKPIMGPPSWSHFNLITSQRPFLQIPSLGGLSLQHVNWGRDMNIRSFEIHKAKINRTIRRSQIHNHWRFQPPLSWKVDPLALRNGIFISNNAPVSLFFSDINWPHQLSYTSSQDRVMGPDLPSHFKQTASKQKQTQCTTQRF